MNFFGIEKKEYNRKFNMWCKTLPEDYIEKFIINGLKPFLKKYKYNLGFSDKDFIKYFKTWAFNYLNGMKLEFVLVAHNGGDNEYDWYLHNISIDEWDELCNQWSTTQLFDDSDAGIYQRCGLSLFVWNCISLENSEQHYCMIDMNNEIEEEEQWIYEENQAYGGDRRTY